MTPGGALAIVGRKGKYKPPKKDERPATPIDDALRADRGDGDGANPFVSRGGLKLRRALDAFGPVATGRDTSEPGAAGLDPSGLWCADLGCSTGGFTDCLLQAGAARVYAVDTAYGELAWSVRSDDRVVVMERTNAVHAEVPAEVVERGGVDLVVIDLGWTAQAKAIPAALRWLGSGPTNESGTQSRDEPEAQAKGRREAHATDEPEAPAKDERTEIPSLALQAREAAQADSRVGRIISLIKPHYEVAKDELGEGGVLDPERAEAVTREVCDAMPGLGAAVLNLVESPVLGGQKRGKGTGNREWLVLLEPTTIPS